MANDETGTWVVYDLRIRKDQRVVKAVCRQAEWDALERARPGEQPIVQAGLRTEGEADTVARGEPPVVPPARRRSRWQKGPAA